MVNVGPHRGYHIGLRGVCATLTRILVQRRTTVSSGANINPHHGFGIWLPRCVLNVANECCPNMSVVVNIDSAVHMMSQSMNDLTRDN